MLSCNATAKATTELSDKEVFTLLRSLIYNDNADQDETILAALSDGWEMGMVAPLVEIMRFSSDRKQLKHINELLQMKTGEEHTEFFEWMRWLWDTKPELKPYYYDFKAQIYKNVDPKFERYFTDRAGQANIRLEEVVWGGVLQDGIPPLRHPELTTASEQDYLSDSDVVFGAYINGEAKAYPKRILAWHEMFIDDFGDATICGVYCTLCGTVIAYNTEHKGKHYNLGTSGFLYRSNKLMYDQATQSLWNTIEGKPVLGPLYDQGIELDVLPIVTTTWGEWKKTHPDTKVLTLNTGHLRDYNEGIAYQEYFGTDELMFPVPKLNKDLLNKDEVLILRTDGFRDDPIAIAIKYLKKNRIYSDKVMDTAFVALADKTGASRVYESKQHKFNSYKRGKLKDSNGQVWKVSPVDLTGPNGEVLKILPSHNTFWFAWYNTYPNTRLIK